MSERVEPHIEPKYIWDNPASRLLAIIENIRALNGGMQTVEGWKMALNAQSMPTLYRRFSLACVLPDSVIECLKRVQPDYTIELYGHWYEQVNAMFFKAGMNAGNWQTVINSVDHHAFKDLKTTKILIDNARAPNSSSLPVLDDLLTNLREIMKEVHVDSEMSLQLKIYVTDILKGFIDRIEEAFITGFLPVERAVDGTFGHAARFKDFNDLAETTIGQRLRTVIQDLANIVTISQGITPSIPTLLEAATKWISIGR